MMPDFSTANILSLIAQELILASVGVILPVMLRIRHPRSQVLYCHALLAICLALPFAQPWHRTPVVIRTSASAPEAALDTAGVALPAEQAPALSQPVAQGSPVPFLAFPSARVIAWIVGAGVLARLLWLFAGLWKIRAFRIAASPLYPVPEPLKAAASLTQTDALFCISADTPSPVTMGLLSPVILLPEAFCEFGEEAQCGIACHELLHVRRNDWLVTVIEEIAGSLLWFNPAVWWLLAQARLAREQVVDAEAVRLTAAREPYMDALLALARGRRVLDLAPAPLFLRRPHLIQRMHSLLKEVPMSKLRLMSSYASIAALVTCAGWFALESFPLMARQQVTQTGGPQAITQVRQAPLPTVTIAPAATAPRPKVLLSALN